MGKLLYKYTFLDKGKYVIRKEHYYIEKEKEDCILYKTSENVESALLMKVERTDLDKIELDDKEITEAYSMFSLNGDKLVDFTEQITKQVKEKLDKQIRELQHKKGMLNGVKQKAISISKLKIRINR